MTDYHSKRPAHDLRYALNGDKLEDLGWKVPVYFNKTLQKTVDWTLQNKHWLEE